MDTLSATDISRMILSIAHESNSRVKEIKLEAIQEYNLVKNTVVLERKRQLAELFSKQCAEIEKLKQQTESRLRKEYKIKKERLRAKVFDAVFERAERVLRTRQMGPGIVESVLSKIKATDIYVFCNEKDSTLIGAAVESTISEIRELPEEGIGGVVVCTKDGKEVWDNSFKTRLQVFRDRHSDLLNKALFG